MGIFSSIKNAIFGHKADPAPTAQPQAPTDGQPQAMPQMNQPAPTPQPQVDVDAVLAELAKTKGQELNYKTSIVDLMKLLDLDPRLENRKELAEELGYTGAKDGSAEMNIWLHKAVMKKLAESGGQVPADLKD